MIGLSRGIARMVMPYRSPVANAINLLVWAVAVAGLATSVSLVVHDFWQAWPWQHNTILLVVLSPNLLGDAENWKYSLLIVIMLSAFAGQWVGIALAKRRGLSRVTVAPFAFIILLWGFAWYESSIPLQRLRFTAAGMWYTWGFVRWHQVERYSWARSRPFHLDGIPGTRTDPILILTLKPAFLTPRTLSWVIDDYDQVSVNKFLARYVSQ
jgi:hypothetical protein